MTSPPRESPSASGRASRSLWAARLHVVTGKGGTGKTTVAAALALALAVEGRRTLLVEVEGRPVADPTSMLNLIAALPPGKPATMKVKRSGQEIDATITVGRRPKPQARPAE